MGEGSATSRASANQFLKGNWLLRFGSMLSNASSQQDVPGKHGVEVLSQRQSALLKSRPLKSSVDAASTSVPLDDGTDTGAEIVHKLPHVIGK